MDAFVDFHYVQYAGRKYFINEICIIKFDGDCNRFPTCYSSSTFNFKDMPLDYKSSITYNYTKKHCHGLDYTDGELPAEHVTRFVNALSDCRAVYVRGSMKRRILVRKIRELGFFVPVYNITAKIAKVLSDNVDGNHAGSVYRGKNLPGYVTYEDIKSKYKTESGEACRIHAVNDTIRDRCIVGQCYATCRWFIDNYYDMM